MLGRVLQLQRKNKLRFFHWTKITKILFIKPNYLSLDSLNKAVRYISSQKHNPNVSLEHPGQYTALVRKVASKDIGISIPKEVRLFLGLYPGMEVNVSILRVLDDRTDDDEGLPSGSDPDGL